MTKKGLTGFANPRSLYVVLGLILVIYILNGVFYIRAQSITSDEGSFINYAVRLVKGHPERTRPVQDNSKMPIIVLNLLPRAIDQLLHPGLAKHDNGDSDIMAGRYITLFVSLFTILLVFEWSREMYGIYAGLFSAFLISICPNMISNAGLVTTDSYSMFFLTLTVFLLWKFCREKSFGFFILFSVSIAFSQLAKQSLFHLYIIAPVILAVYYFIKRPPLSRNRFIKYIFCFIFINWLIINLGFYFRNTNTAIGDYQFMSNLFLNLQHIFPSGIPIPFPKAFVTGLDQAKYFDQIGGGDDLHSSFGKVTILGNSSTGGSFWYYYIVSFFFKTPISTMIFISGSLTLLFLRRTGRGFIGNEFFLLLPVAYFLFYMSLFYKTQCGIRQFIFIYPFLYILCGMLIVYLPGFYFRLSVICLSLFLVISVIRYWRNYYPYTNEFILNKTLAYCYVGASNLEFGQANFFYQEYLREHPDVNAISDKSGPGNFLITTNDYLDIWNRHKYSWIADIKPTSQVAYSGLLITVKEQDMYKIGKKINGE